MNWPYLAGILTVACVFGIIAIIASELDGLRKKERITKNIYRDISPHQVIMMKQIFPRFDWERIDREIAEVQNDSSIQYQPSYIAEDGVVECLPKRLDIQV